MTEHQLQVEAQSDQKSASEFNYEVDQSLRAL